jgi:LmeA-like phospholipid-binding
LKKLAVVAVIAVLFLIALDQGARLLTGALVGREVGRALELDGDADVSVGGFPFLPGAIPGSFSSATVDVEGFVSGTLRFDRVRLSLEDVSASFGDLLSGDQAVIRARRGEGVAELTAADVTRALRTAGLPVTVTFEGTRVSLGSDLLPGSVDVEVSLDGQQLVLSPVDVPLPVTVALELPSVIGGMTYTGARVRGGRGVLNVQLRDARFEVRG